MYFLRVLIGSLRWLGVVIGQSDYLWGVYMTHLNRPTGSMPGYLQIDIPQCSSHHFANYLLPFHCTSYSVNRRLNKKYDMVLKAGLSDEQNMEHVLIVKRTKRYCYSLDTWCNRTPLLLHWGHPRAWHKARNNEKKKYRKIPIISPGLMFVQKAVLLGFFFGGAYFRRGLLLEGILRFKMG